MRVDGLDGAPTVAAFVVLSGFSCALIYLWAQLALVQLCNSPMRARGSQGESRRRCEVGVNMVIGHLSGKRGVETEVSEA